jgi:ADP-ribose pyrophosphatase
MLSKQMQVSSFVDEDVEIIGRDIVYQGFFKMEKVQLRHRLFKGGWTPTFSREIFVRGQAVAAVMYDPKNNLIGLIEQFRVGALNNNELNRVALGDVALGKKATATDALDKDVLDVALTKSGLVQSNLNNTSGITSSSQKGGITPVSSPWLYEVVAGMTEPGEAPEDVILRELVEEAGMVPDKLLPICQYFTSPGGTDETLVLFCALGDLTQVEGIHGLSDEHEDIRVLVMPEQVVFDDIYGGRFNNAATLICLQWLFINRDQIIA